MAMTRSRKGAATGDNRTGVCVDCELCGRKLLLDGDSVFEVAVDGRVLAPLCFECMDVASRERAAVAVKVTVRQRNPDGVWASWRVRAVGSRRHPGPV
jgi:hypothetical protein